MNTDDYIKIKNKMVFLVDKSVLVITVLCSIIFKVFSIYGTLMCIISIIIMYHNILIDTFF